MYLYVVDELMRNERRGYLRVPEPLSAQQIYSFLSGFIEGQFIRLVLGIPNTLYHKRGRGRTEIFIDATDILPQ